MCVRFGDGWAAFVVRDAVVQNLPHESRKPMRDRSDRLRMAHADDESPVEQLKDTSLGLHRGLGGLIQQSTHLPVATRRAVTMVNTRALVVPWTGPHPGGEGAFPICTNGELDKRAEVQ